MEKLMKGDVVVLPFPFSDLTSTKKRPAIVVANLPGNDFILCQVTTQKKRDEYAIEVKQSDFKQGNLPVVSIARPNKLFTADKAIILRKAGTLTSRKIKEIEDGLIQIFRE